MKWDCGETYGEKYERWSKWHNWFAWYPVKVADHDCRWLETIERQLNPDSHYFSWYYRPKPIAKQSAEMRV